MSFAKLAAESLVDEEAVDAERSAAKRKKILLGVAALAGVAGLGGLAYANRDKLKGMLASKPPEKSLGQQFLEGSGDPKVIATGAIGAAAGLPAVRAIKDGYTAPTTVGEAHKRLLDHNRFPDADVKDTWQNIWRGAPDPAKMEAAKRLRAAGVGTNPSGVDWLGGQPAGTSLDDAIKNAPAHLKADLPLLNSRHARQTWRAGPMVSRGLLGAAATAAPALLNWGTDALFGAKQ